jgi:hypothetical protein
MPASPHSSVVLETKAHLGPNLGLGNASLLLKMQWFYNTARLEDYLFCSINTSKFFEDGHMNDQPFIFLNEVEQVFFAKDRLNPKRSFICKTIPNAI